MNLESYIQLLASADAALNARNVQLLTEAADELNAYAQSIAHRRSNVMADTITRFGPFPIGSGAYETHSSSAAEYAEDEVAKGGAHDWATRTIVEQDARILQLQLEVENALVTALTGMN